MTTLDEINKLRKTSFTVSSIAVADLKRFKEFCREECGDIYAVGIVQLLKYKEKNEQLLTLLSSLQTQIDEIKKQLNKPKEIKTFG
jgi:hypothetical protein